MKHTDPPEMDAKKESMKSGSVSVKSDIPAQDTQCSDPMPAIYREHPQEYREWMSCAPDEHEQWKTRLAESGIDSVLTEEERNLLEKNRILVSRLDDEDIREIKKVGIEATITDRGWTHWVRERQKEVIGEDVHAAPPSTPAPVEGDPLTRMLAEKVGDDQVSEWAMSVLFTTVDGEPRIRLCDDPRRLSLWRGGRWHEVEAARVGNKVMDIALNLVRTHPGLKEKERDVLINRLSSNSKQKNVLEKMRGDIPPHSGTQSAFLVADAGEDFDLGSFFSDPDEHASLRPVRVTDVRTGGVRDAKIEDKVELVLPFHFPDIPYITPGETNFDVIYDSFEARCTGASRLFADTGSYMVDDEIVRDRTWSMHMLARVGQILCSDLSGHDFLLFLGSGGNGKSLMKRLIERCAAGRTWTASDRIFSVKHRNHPQEVGMTRGRLGIFVEELESDCNWHRINSMVSGETQSYEIKGGENVQFTPTATIVLLCNKVPDIPRSLFEAVGRRAVPVPFDITFGRDIPPREDHDILAGVEPNIPDLVYHALCMYTAAKKTGYFLCVIEWRH